MTTFLSWPVSEKHPLAADTVIEIRSVGCREARNKCSIQGILGAFTPERPSLIIIPQNPEHASCYVKAWMRQTRHRPCATLVIEPLQPPVNLLRVLDPLCFFLRRLVSRQGVVNPADLQAIVRSSLRQEIAHGKSVLSGLPSPSPIPVGFLQWNRLERAGLLAEGSKFGQHVKGIAPIDQHDH
jgi:hypothetical protein